MGKKRDAIAPVERAGVVTIDPLAYELRNYGSSAFNYPKRPGASPWTRVKPAYDG